MSYQNSWRQNISLNSMFPSNKINKSSRIERIKQKLNAAIILGNVFGKKVSLLYRDHYERFSMKEAIVIAVTERFVVLQGGRSIQHNKIRKVTF